MWVRLSAEDCNHHSTFCVLPALGLAAGSVIHQLPTPSAAIPSSMASGSGSGRASPIISILYRYYIFNTVYFAGGRNSASIETGAAAGAGAGAGAGWAAGCLPGSETAVFGC